MPDTSRRRRLTASITLLAVMLSIAGFHMAVLGRAQYFEDAVRIQGWGAIFFSIAAGSAAVIAMPLAVYHFRDLAQNRVHPIVWLPMGVWFGLATPILTGGFSRLAGAFAGLADGFYGVGDMGSLMIDSVLVFPYDMVVQGAPNIYGSIIVAPIFAVAGYAVDRANATDNEAISRWATWIISVAIGLLVLLFALYGPAEFIRDIVR